MSKVMSAFLVKTTCPYARIVLSMILGVLISSGATATTFPVTNTYDAGLGSLRQAITDANAAGAGPHQIVFNVYGQITILTSLPQITNNDVTIDGENKITINSNGTDPVCNPFDIRANNVIVRNFKLTNNGDIDIVIRANTTGVVVEGISASSTTGNYLNTLIYVEGASTNLILRNIRSSDLQPCGSTYFGRGILIVGGLQTNLSIDSIYLTSQSNARACEAIVFRDAAINGLTLTNTSISGFQNAIRLENTGGPVETANNVLLDHVTIDSLPTGVSTGFYSNFVNTNIQIKNAVIDLNTVGTDDDGDYPIWFNNTTNGVTIDSVTLIESDIYFIWFNGAASNITIDHSVLKNTQPGLYGGAQFVRFESTVSNLAIKNTVLNGDKPGNADDADLGIVFLGATTDVTLDSLTINEFDTDGIYVLAANTNFQLTNSTFTNNFDGIEFYNVVPRTNVDIINSSFRGAPGGRSGIVINAGHATSDIDLVGDTVSDHVNNGIWYYGGQAVTDASITGCVVYGNGGAGIVIDQPDKILITQNAVYNNTGLGIDLINAGNCGYEGANRPTLVSSTPLGGGQYELVINLPAIAASGYTVDIYANDPATSPNSGQYYVMSLTGLNSGNNTRTVTYNSGPGATGVGFWTATLRIPANNCGTSEFSNKLNIGLKAPACITNGIVGWYRADMGINGLTWGDISGNANHLTAIGDPDTATGFVNFNPAFYYDGNDEHRAPATAGVAGAYTIIGLGKLEGTQNGRVFSSTTGNKILGWHAGYQDRLYIEGWINSNTNPLTNYTRLYSVKRANTGSGPFEFKGNGVLLNSGTTSNGSAWTLDIAAINGAEMSKVFVPEVFVYNRDLTPAEIQRLESYMGLKYGITLNNGATDYLASDGTTIMWSAATNNGYEKHITGIGKDDCTLLHQKQSVSADTGVVTIALGNAVAASNAANANSVTTDKTFLVFGDNGGSLAFASAVTGTNATSRMARVFKVQKSAAWADQLITLQLKGMGSSNYLLISTDPNFGTISQELALDAAGKVTLNSSLLANGIYFTVGALIKAPGNVVPGITLWLKADDGSANGTAWNDFSGNGKGAAQAEAARQASVLPAAVNFNPALKFDGVNDYLTTSSLFTATGTNNIQVYAVAATDNVQNQDLFGEMVSNGQYVHAHVPWGDGIVYWDAPYGYRAQGAWGGTLGTPYLWSFLRSPSTMSVNRNRAIVGTFTTAMNNIAGSNNPFYVGGIIPTAQAFNGKIAELIVYNNSAATSPTQRQQIESYLAIKYGLTLPVDYLASDGTTKFWDAAANAAWSRHITGIGRDSGSALLQKQSISADTGYVTIALGTTIAASNAANAGAIATDKSFFVTGDNGGAKQFSAAVTGLTGVNVALARTWRVQKTNWTDQDITLRTDSALAAPQFLLISADASFGAGDLVLPLTNRSITLNSSQLPNGAYFTFANALKAPGNVTAGIAAWWRADNEASASSWSDNSGNGKTLTQLNVPQQPELLPVNINYQPALKFGTVDVMSAASLFGTASIDNIAVFAVTAADGAGSQGQGSGLFAEYVSNNERVAAWAPYGNGHIYFYPPLGWAVNTTALPTQPVAYANPRYNLYGFTKTPSQLNIYFNNTNVGTANGTFTGITGNNQAFSLGVFHFADYFNGRIAEFVVYNNSAAMTATDRQKIHSYLALKYGLTLNLTGVPGYLASDGSTYFDAAANAGYLKRITGIGRDSVTALHQKQSISLDTGVVAIALGNTVAASNALNASAITNDKSFFVFGDNGASAAFVTPVTGFGGLTNRMARVFKVDKTANWADQDITLKLQGGNANISLLVSTDAVFDGSDTRYVLNADSTVTLNTSSLPDGIYFTFAIDIKGPNGVNNGINFWLRADDGNTSGAAWKDYAGYGHQALQGTVANQPATDAKGMNFNYGLKFDGADDFLDITTTRVHPDSATIFVAASGAGFAAVRDLVSSGAVGSAHGMEFRLTGATGALNYLENAASVLGVGGVSTHIENRPYLFSATQNNLANGMKLYQNHRLDNQGTVNLSPLTANLVSIGSRTIAARGLFWQGNISEVIIYNRVLADAERQLVESYLGLKYGITLNNGATSYLASDNAAYWTADATYKSRITGIGRDDSTTLNTKVSLSADTGFVTLALGTSIPITNETNSNTITNNKSFLVFADNGLSASNFTVGVTGSAHNVTRRMARVWKVQKTNWADQNITFKVKPIGIDNYLLISSDPTFATYSQEIPVAADGTVTFSSALFTGSDIYYTFGGPLKSPGGVPGHAMWVRADIGTSSGVNNTAINEWTDMSAFANNLTQATAANQPTFQNNQFTNINFNPVVRFDGVNNVMTGASILGTGTYNAAATFVVNNQVAPTNSILWTEATGLGTQFTLHATWGDNIVYWDPPYVSNRLTYNAGNVVNQSILWTATSDINAPSNKQSIFRNGMNVANGNNSSQYTGNNSQFQLGRNMAGGISYNGRIAEVIIYTSALTPVQQQQVNTYMALKYGITLNNGNTSYLATDGTTTVWDAAANAAYKKNIAGIGRDDEEALGQKQSRSINTGLQVTIGLGSIDSTNAANPNSFAADKSYLVWGDDSGSVVFSNPVTGVPNVNARIGRTWKVQESGTVGDVVVAVPKSAIPLNATTFYLIVSNDASFGSGDNFIPLTLATLNGQLQYTATADFTTGQYFSIGAFVTAPGAIVSGLILWNKADDGVLTGEGTTVPVWRNTVYDSAYYDLLQAAPASQALYYGTTAGKMQNFNPALQFDGSNDFFRNATRLFPSTTGFQLITVAEDQAPARTTLRATLGTGADGNYPTMDLQTDGAAPNGWNPWMTGSTPAEWSGGDARLFNGNTGGTNRQPQVFSLGSDNASAAAVDNINSWIDGYKQATTLDARQQTEIGNNVWLGSSGGDGWWNGLIPEAIIYNRQLTDAEMGAVNTYLAIKYGIRLDQRTPTDYILNDATVIWNATTNANWRFNIAGIGRQDEAALLQKQSRSVNAGTQLAIGLGSLDSANTINANTFTTDRSYLVWGDDSAATTFTTPFAVNTNVNYRMSRVWRVQETGTIGQVEIGVPFDALPNPRQSWLVVSNDNTFDATDTFIPLYDIMVGSKRHWAAKVDLTSGQYFTIAAFIKSPGGVGATSLWVRADKGVQNNTDGMAVDMWVDYGNEVNNASQATAAIQPVYQNNPADNINYNPVVKFNGTSQMMNLDVTKLPVGTSPRTLIGVGSLNSIASSRYIIGYGTAGTNQGAGIIQYTGGAGNFIGYANDVITAAGFWQANMPNELFGTWAGAGGQANLYSKMTTLVTPVAKPWNTGTGGARIGNSPWGAEYWSGPITEVIAFDRELTNTERQRVTTYLAIRNGYTIDQTTPYSNYLNTNSTVIWDATTNAAYRNNIAGIGRDDIEGLDQRQAKSINGGAILAIGLGALATDNLANANTFSSDTSYLLWGSNSTALTVSNTDLPAVFSQRLTQEWKVSLHSFNNALAGIAMEFDLNGITHMGSSTADFTLLIDADGDGDFTTGTISQLTANDYTAGKVSFNNITGLTHNAVFTLAIGPQSLRLTAKAVLQGAWNGTAMRTDLKAAGVLPATDPYGQNTTPSVSPNATTAQVVDWVLLELRDDANPTTVVASRAAFLLSNGNIVDTNYLQPVAFPNVPDASYRLAVRHRNHLGVMTLDPVDFSTGVPAIDFTLTATTTYGNHARKDLGSGTWGLWAGDVEGDQSIRYSAKPSDASGVVSAVLTHAGNTAAAPGYTGFINAYSPFDVNLDGRVYYTAAPSDRDIIVNNVLTHPANLFGLAAYVIRQQLP